MRPTESTFARAPLQGTTQSTFHQIHSEKLVAHVHLKTLHGGLSYTMTEVRERFWIPKLRQLIKRVIHKCYGRKRFRAVAFPDPAVGDLPLDRTSGSRQF